MILLLTACTAVIDFPPPEIWWESADTGPVGIVDTGTNTPSTPDPTTDPPTSTPEPEGVKLVAVDSQCIDGPRVTARANAWVASGEVLLMSADAAERHPLAHEASAPDGSWDELGIGPLVAVDASEQQSGTSTRFPCGTELTVVVLIRDAADALVACGVHGADPAAAVARARADDPEITQLGGCPVF